MPGSGVRVPHNPLVSVCPPSVTEISMKPSEVQIAQNLQALTSRESRRIITSLNREPLSAAQLAKECKLTPASIAKHLGILIEAGLVKVRTVEGRKMAHLQRSKFKGTLEWFGTLISE